MGDIKMSTGNNILKILVGLVILVIGVVWYTGPQIAVGNYVLFGWYGDLIVLLKGTVGLFLLFIGLIITWMGYDDYKMDKEMTREGKTESE